MDTSDSKQQSSYYYMLDNVVSGPSSVSDIEHEIMLGKIPKGVLIHAESGGDWVPYHFLFGEQPIPDTTIPNDYPQKTEKTESQQASSAARVCDIIAVISLALGIIGGLLTGELYISGVGFGGFICLLAISSIINASFNDRARQNEKIIDIQKAILEELKNQKKQQTYMMQK